MGVLDRIRSGGKAVADLRFSGAYGLTSPGNPIRFLLPGSQFDYERAVGDPWRHSSVNSGLRFIQTNIVKPDLVIKQKKKNKQDEILPDHALLKGLNPPNPDWSLSELLKAVSLSMVCAGNSYVIKARGMGGYGEPVEYWWVPHFYIEPQYPTDGSKWISHYLYQVEGKRQEIQPGDIIHFKMGRDPRNPRKGLSPLAALFREIFTDTEAMAYTAAILRNAGIPSVIVSPKDNTTKVTPESRETFNLKWTEHFTGEGRGKPFTPSTPVDVHAFGLDPTQLALKEVHHLTEERVSGALGLPANVLQFGGGLQHSSTRANFKDSINQAFDSCIVPMGDDIAETLDRCLLPDFPQFNNGRFHFGWDYRHVPAMQEDQSELAKRGDVLFTSGIAKRNEARLLNSLEDDGDDRYIDEIPGLKAATKPEGSGNSSGGDGSGGGSSTDSADDLPGPTGEKDPAPQDFRKKWREKLLARRRVA